MNIGETETGPGEVTGEENYQSTQGPIIPEDQGSTASSEVKHYTASIYSGYAGKKSTIPTDLAQSVLDLEELFTNDTKNGTKIATQVWLLVQPGKKEHESRPGAYAELNKDVRRAFFSQRDRLSRDERVVLLIDSTGGSAKAGYQLAMFFRRYAGKFVALVPNVAKSAATLLAIGADEIILGHSGELGPVDAQVLEGIRYVPALDRVKALERLQASALEAFDRTMALLTLRSEQNIDELIPIAAGFAARLSEPYLQKQDMVEYTRMSRVLKIGEDYASRLLYRQGKQESKQQNGYKGTQADDRLYLQNAEGAEVMVEAAPLEEEWLSDYSDPSKRRARALAQHLVGAYPDHDFAIDMEEARRIGLQVSNPSNRMAQTIDKLHQVLTDPAYEGLTAMGRVEEAKVG
jgi:hypothetical protein